MNKPPVTAIAKALFDHIRRADGWVAVRIRDDTAWEVCKPRSQKAMAMALATEGLGVQTLKDELYATARELMAADLVADSVFDGIDIALGFRVADTERSVECPDCKGEGQIEHPAMPLHGLHSEAPEYALIDCDTCRGTGRVWTDE